MARWLEIDGAGDYIQPWEEPGYIPVIYSLKELTCTLNVSYQTVRNYVKRGMPQVGHGKYDLLRVYAWLYWHGIANDPDWFLKSILRKK